MIISAKFFDGQMVYNSITKETGRVERSYEDRGICMYRVTVPLGPFSWSWSLASDWEETRLESSANGELN
jgi:hypothetical protein